MSTQRYALTAILSDRMTAEDLQGWQASMGERIQTLQGTMRGLNNLGRRALAYRMKGGNAGFEQTGTPIVVEFDLAGNKLAELERQLKLEPNILRMMIVHAKPHEQAAPIPAAPQSAVPIPSGAPALESPGEPSSTVAPQKPAEQPLSPDELDKRLDEILESKALSV